jgi:hypothetical protein
LVVAVAAHGNYLFVLTYIRFTKRILSCLIKPAWQEQ